MEGVIDNIVGKIDSVLSKLEAMERSKNKRKANMSKILDGFTMNPESKLGFIRDGKGNGNGGKSNTFPIMNMNNQNLIK